MKRIALISLALLLVFLMFGGCGNAEDGKIENSTSENSGMVENKNDNTGKDSIMKYDENGISFDVPESWRDNFKSVSKDVGTGEDKYTKTDFIYNLGERDILVMSVGRFTKPQWEKLKKSQPDAEDAKLGESKSGEYVYSIFYEDHDYIEDDELEDILENVRREATSLRSTINIK